MKINVLVIRRVLVKEVVRVSTTVSGLIENPASVHLDFNVKPAKAHKVENACVGGETMVTNGSHKHRKMLMRSEGYLPSTR